MPRFQTCRSELLIGLLFVVLFAPGRSVGQVCAVPEAQKILAELLDPEFGNPVAIDGDLAMVGTRRFTSTFLLSSPGTGMVHVLSFEDDKWTPTQTLNATDGMEGDHFGYSIAFEGDVAVIGAPGDDHDPLGDVGSAYVFTRSNGAWSQGQKLVPSNSQLNGYLGAAVAIAGDVLILGAPGFQLAGAAFVYRFDGSVWILEQQITASDASSGDQFGGSVAIDGNLAVIGAFGVGSDHGAVYVFEFDGSSWMEQQKLSAPDGNAGDRFGWSVDVDDQTIAAGAPQSLLSLTSAVYVFETTGPAWELAAQLPAPELDQNGNLFGFSVDLRGSRLVIGAPMMFAAYALIPNDPPSLNAGAAYLYERDDDEWALQHKLQKDYQIGYGNPNDHGRLGASVAMSDTTIVLASPKAISPSSPNNGAYFFDVEPPDCDGNDQPDVCDADCNHTRVPDACEIDSGYSSDCNRNTVPDECDNGFDYLLDSGLAVGAWGFWGPNNPNGGDMLFLNQFSVKPGGQRITHIALPWTGFTPDGTSATLLLYDDPNNDGDPHDAVLLASEPALATDDFGLAVLMNFSIYPIPPTLVGEVGESFFVGGYMQAPQDVGVVAADAAAVLDRSWIATAKFGQADIQNPGNNANLHLTTNLIVRALSLDCDGNGAWDQCDIDAGLLSDVNANGIPDPCEPKQCVGDIDDSGALDVDDLLALLGAWGACPPPQEQDCPADILQNGQVDASDLLALLNLWGSCP